MCLFRLGWIQLTQITPYIFIVSIRNVYTREFQSEEC